MVLLEWAIFLLIAIVVLPIVFGITLVKFKTIRTMIVNPKESRWHDPDTKQENDS